MWNAPEKIANDYYAFVKECLVNEKAFSNFKSNPAYCNVVGMSHPYQADMFYARVKADPEIYNKLLDFRWNDTIGAPPAIVKIEGMLMSPNTLRHISTLVDLKKHFGSLDGKVISELGVGYGATAYMINKYYKPSAYHLIDLPDVQQLALKYLSLFKITATAEPPPPIVDLFISEFCISEFDDVQLYDFYNKYVANAKNAYIMSNLFDAKRKDALIDRMNEDFNLEVYNDSHGTEYPTYFIIGKK